MKKQKKTAKKKIELLKSISETEQVKVNGGNRADDRKKGAGGIWINNHNEMLLRNEAIA